MKNQKEKQILKNYKPTIMGVIPVDWEINRIGNICQIFGRIGYRGYTIKDIVKEEQGAITISPSNIINNKINFINCTYISWFKYEESPEIKIFNGDILLVKTGSTYGKTALVKDLHKKATINPQLIVLKNIKVDNVFLGYVMGFKTLQTQIKSTIVGGAIPTLSQQEVSNFKFALPPTKSEQTAIATVLSDTDALIENLEKLIAKKKAIKQGTMQQLLTGKKRLPGFNGKWEVKKLKDIAVYRRGSFPQPYGLPKWYDDYNGMPFVQVYDVDSNMKLKETTKQNISDMAKDKSVFVEKGSLILTLQGSIGRIAKTQYDCYVDRTLLIFTNFLIPMDKIFFMNIVSQLFQIEKQKAPGGTIKTITKEELSNFEVSFPEKIEQTAIATFLSDMDAEIEILEQNRDKYIMLKQGMMQQLLTGRIRLV